MGVFLTITSPVFSEIAIVLTEHAANFFSEEALLFETLGKMNEVRPFKLVFLLDVWGSPREEARRKLAGALDLVATKGLLDFLGSPPTIRWVGSHHYGRETSFPDVNSVLAGLYNTMGL